LLCICGWWSSHQTCFHILQLSDGQARQQSLWLVPVAVTTSLPLTGSNPLESSSSTCATPTKNLHLTHREVCAFHIILLIHSYFSLPLNSINRLVHVAETWCVSCEVRTEFVYIIWKKSKILLFCGPSNVNIKNCLPSYADKSWLNFLPLLITKSTS
jgi:hypothetical protein